MKNLHLLKKAPWLAAIALGLGLSCVSSCFANEHLPSDMQIQKQVNTDMADGEKERMSDLNKQEQSIPDMSSPDMPTPDIKDPGELTD